MPPINLSQYDEIIDAKARQYGLPTGLVRSLIWQESRGNAKAVSPVGAQGLMQLMPETAKQLGVKNSFDPVQNIDGGVRYLKQQIDKFGLVGGVAAYNAGPGNVQKYKGIPPFKETQDYVKKVLGNFDPSYSTPQPTMQTGATPSGLPSLASFKEPYKQLQNFLGIKPEQPQTPESKLSQLMKSFSYNRPLEPIPLNNLRPFEGVSGTGFNVPQEEVKQLITDKKYYPIAKFIDTPLVSSESVRKVIDAFGPNVPLQQWYLNKLDPQGPLDRLLNSIDDVRAGVNDFTANTVSGLTTPKNIAIGAVAPIPILGPAVIGSQIPGMIGGAADSLGQTVDRFGQGDYRGGTEALLSTIANTAMAAGGAKYTASKIAPLVTGGYRTIAQSIPENIKTAFADERGSFSNKPITQLPPETIETLQPKLESLAQGAIKAVVVPKGSPMPEVPQGMASLPTKQGTWIYDPSQVKPFQIKSSIAKGTFQDLLSPAAKDLVPMDLPGKERGFVTTVKESPMSPPELAQGVQGRYDPISNQTTVELAKARIAKNPIKARDEILSADNHSALDVATGIELMQKYNKEGDFSQSITIAEKMAERATKNGQAVQAYSIYDRLGPEGLQQLAIKKINEARRNATSFQKKKLDTEISKIKTEFPDLPKDQVIEIAAKKLNLPNINPEFMKQIYDRASLLDKLPEGSPERVIATAEILRDISNQIPSSLLRKIATFQTMAQLGNPKTIIRNVLGNAAFAVAENVKDIVAYPIDRAVSLATGERTKSLSGFNQIGAQTKGFVEGLREGVSDAWKGIDVTRIADKWEINRMGSGLPQTQAFRGKVLGNIERTVGVTLRAPDRAFYKAAFNKSIAEQMALKRVNKPTPEMIAQANFEGLYKTFQDDSAAARLFSGIKRELNFGKEFGAGDILLKYPKTPGNLLSRSLDYSPAGFVKSVFEIGKAITNRGFNQKSFVDSTSRALVGSVGFTALGYGLSQLGLLRNTAARNPDLRAVEQTTGINQSQLNTTGLLRWITSGFDPEAAKMQKGDTLVSYDWAVPISVPMSMGARAQEQVKETQNKEKSPLDFASTFASGLEGGLETLGDQPLIKTFTKLFQGKSAPQALVEATKGIPSSFTPTLFKQFSQLLDNTKRDVRDPNPIKMAVNLVLGKVPFANEKLPAQIDVFGKPMENYQGGTNSIFNVMFNPAFVSKYNPSPAAQTVLDLYKSTGDKKVLPDVIDDKFKFHGIDFELNPRQRNYMQRWVGTRTESFLKEISQRPEFQALPESERVKLISNQISNYKTAAQAGFFIDQLNQKPSNQRPEYMAKFFQDNKLSPEQIKSVLKSMALYQVYK